MGRSVPLTRRSHGRSPQAIRDWLDGRSPGVAPQPPARSAPRGAVHHFHRPGASFAPPPRPRPPPAGRRDAELRASPVFQSPTRRRRTSTRSRRSTGRKVSGAGGERGAGPGAVLTPRRPAEPPPAGPQHGKHLIEDLIIESSKFPAAQPPDPNQPAKIETDYWPCPPSLAVVGGCGVKGGGGRGDAGGGTGLTAPVVPQRRSGGGGWRPKGGRRRRRI